MLKKATLSLLLLGLAAFALSGCSSNKGTNNNGGGTGNSLTFDQVLTSGTTFSHVFSDVGSTGYHCKFHSNMTGSITVTSGGTPITKNVSIVDRNTGFSPSSISVPVGSTVVWTNNDTISHSVTSD